MHVDTGHNFDEVIEFRDRTVERRGCAWWSRASRTTSRPDGWSTRPGRGPAATACRRTHCCAASGRTSSMPVRRRPPRRGEGPSQGACLQLPRRVRAVGSQGAAARTVEPLQRAAPAREHIRVFPLSNWTELDIWQYILEEEIELPSIYYAHRRPGRRTGRNAVGAQPVPDTAARRGSHATSSYVSAPSATRPAPAASNRRPPLPPRSSPRSRPAASPNAAPPAPTTGSPRPAWKTARRRGTSDGPNPATPPRRHRGQCRRTASPR